MDHEDEGWVKIPYDGLLEVHGDGDEKTFSRKYVKSPEKLFKPNYFNTPRTSRIIEEPGFEKQLDHKEEVKEMINLPTAIMESRETSSEAQSNQDPIFQVFFNKENQFVETKMDSPRLSSRESDLSHIETGAFQYEGKDGDHMVNCSSPSKMIKEEVVAWNESKQRLNFWKWGVSGIGVFCSVGMAAATICIIICGNGRRHKQQSKKLRIQINPENKRIQQVVQKANEAMSAVRGVPLVKAQITYGGYYESI